MSTPSPTAPLLQRWTSQDEAGVERPIGWVLWCPACQKRHYIAVEASSHTGGAVWLFNGRPERPAFSPSLKVREFVGVAVSVVCHFFVSDGRLVFQPDSTHKLAGVTVPMAPISP